MRFYARCLSILGRIELVIATVLMAVVIVCNVCEILARYFLGTSIYWVQEGTIMLAGWITFLGIGVIYKRREDINVDYLTRRFDDRTKAVVALFIHIASLWALALVVWYGFVLYEFQVGMLNETLQIPDNYYYVPVIIAGASLFLTILYDIIETLRGLLRGDAGQPRPS